MWSRVSIEGDRPPCKQKIYDDERKFCKSLAIVEDKKKGELT